MDLNLVVKEWRCPCGYGRDTREVMEGHVLAEHPDRPTFWLMELHLNLSLVQISESERPDKSVQEPASLYQISGPCELVHYETRAGATLRVAKQVSFGIRGPSCTEAVVLEYIPYAVMVTFGGRGCSVMGLTKRLHRRLGSFEECWTGP